MSKKRRGTANTVFLYLRSRIFVLSSLQKKTRLSNPSWFHPHQAATTSLHATRHTPHATHRNGIFLLFPAWLVLVHQGRRTHQPASPQLHLHHDGRSSGGAISPPAARARLFTGTPHRGRLFLLRALLSAAELCFGGGSRETEGRYNFFHTAHAVANEKQKSSPPSSYQGRIAGPALVAGQLLCWYFDRTIFARVAENYTQPPFDCDQTFSPQVKNRRIILIDRSRTSRSRRSPPRSRATAALRRRAGPAAETEVS